MFFILCIQIIKIALEPISEVQVAIYNNYIQWLIEIFPIHLWAIFSEIEITSTSFTFEISN